MPADHRLNGTSPRGPEEAPEEPDDHRIELVPEDLPGPGLAMETAESPDDHRAHTLPEDEPGPGHGIEMSEEPDDDEAEAI